MVELEFGDIGFCGGRKTVEPGEKPSEQGENQQQTQPTLWHRAGIEPGLHWCMGGERSQFCTMPVSNPI